MLHLGKWGLERDKIGLISLINRINRLMKDTEEGSPVQAEPCCPHPCGPARRRGWGSKAFGVRAVPPSPPHYSPLFTGFHPISGAQHGLRGLSFRHSFASPAQPGRRVPPAHRVPPAPDTSRPHVSGCTFFCQ